MAGTKRDLRTGLRARAFRSVWLGSFLEDRAPEDRLPPRQHLVDRRLHARAHLMADGAYDRRIVGRLGAVLALDVDRLQEAGMPLRGERQAGEGEVGGQRQVEPLGGALDPLPVEPAEDRVDLGA